MKQELLDDNLVIHEEATLKEALAAISDNRKSAVVVVDVNGVLRGIASDGDIRRAMLKGVMLQTPIGKLINENAAFLRKNEAHKAQKLFKDHPEYTMIPVVGEHNRLVDICVRDLRHPDIDK